MVLRKGSVLADSANRQLGRTLLGVVAGLLDLEVRWLGIVPVEAPYLLMLGGVGGRASRHFFQRGINVIGANVGHEVVIGSLFRILPVVE
jgi:hypothetical protein